ncbi:MAG: GAF domain-containing protein [Lachnospirales bacterium]
MIELFNTTDIDTKYKYLLSTIKDTLEHENNVGANLSNITAILNYYLSDINWVGFYLCDEKKENELVLSYFQGNVACTRIPFGKGVCGTAILENRILVVEDVHKFPGHIACDSASNSEIVIPINVNNKKYGVLDIDSPLVNRFSQKEVDILKDVVIEIEKFLSRI